MTKALCAMITILVALVVTGIICLPLAKDMGGSKTMNLCRGGKHQFKEVSSRPTGSHMDEVVRWCFVCGSLVVDLEYDGRLRPGDVLPIQHPELYLETLKQ